MDESLFSHKMTLRSQVCRYNKGVKQPGIDKIIKSTTRRNDFQLQKQQIHNDDWLDFEFEAENLKLASSSLSYYF